MTTKKTVNAQKIEDVVKNIGDITLGQIWDETINDGNNKRKSSVEKLVATLVTKIIGLSADPLGNNSEYSIEDKKRISNFLVTIGSSIRTFIHFLDYDGDNKLELVKKDENGNVIIGDDIKLFVDDMKRIGSSFKHTNNVSDIIISLISKLIAYFSSDVFTETKEDFIMFSRYVSETVTASKEMKHVKHSGVIADKADDIVSFVIILCIVIVPIIDLVDERIAYINSINNDGISTIEEIDMVITNKDIANAFSETYGVSYDFIIDVINRLVAVFMKNIDESTWKKIFGKCFPCCFKSTSIE